jgi:hypothetical protein
MGVHHHRHDRVGVAETASHSDHRHPLGDQPGRMGVAQVMEVQPAVFGPEVGQLGLGQGALPHADEVVVRQGAARAAGAAGARVDAVIGAATDQLPVRQERVHGLSVQGDHPLAGLGLGPLPDPSAGPAGVADRPGDPQPPGAAHRTVIEGLVEAGVVPAQGGQLAQRIPVRAAIRTSAR